METSESSPEARPADVSAGTSKAPPEAQDDSNYSPTALRTRQRVGPGQVIQAPLRQAVGPGGESLLVHVPFTTLDLLNWKHSVGPYRENLTEMHQLLETVMISHNPNWADLQALLNTLLTVEEKRMVVEKAQAETRNLHPREDVELLPVKKDPKWDPNTDRDRMKVQASLIAVAMREGGRSRGERKEISRRQGQEKAREARRKTHLGPNQSAICKKEGHWKTDCPLRKKKNTAGSEKRKQALIMLEDSD
uniref:Core shell protein Gag P30 domain-containing protein n=1 Tax=Anser cygnoides TaxID=8845 RepID=A0A8B9EMI4_ANSCY